MYAIRYLLLSMVYVHKVHCHVSDVSTYTCTCMYNDISCINYHFSLLLLQYLFMIFP